MKEKMENVNIKKYYQGVGKVNPFLSSKWLWTDGNQFIYLVH